MRQFNTYVASDKVIVTTRFANKVIKGIAKCNPNDTFDKEIGEKLAKARCVKKLTQAIFDKKRKHVNYAQTQVTKATNALRKAELASSRSYNSALYASNELTRLENSLK